MVSQVLGVDEYIIDVDDDEGVEELPGHLVHEFLEDGVGVGKAIWHNEEIIVTSRSDEGRLPLIAFPDTNEAIRTTQNQLRKHTCSTEFLKSGRDQGKWIREFHHLVVQSAVVNTGLQAPVLLIHEETRG